MAMRISSGKVPHAELRLELRTGIGDRFVAHVQVLGDDAVGLAFGHEH